MRSMEELRKEADALLSSEEGLGENERKRRVRRASLMIASLAVDWTVEVWKGNKPPLTPLIIDIIENEV